MCARYWQWLLAIFLVFGQGLALAHQVDLDLHTESEACEICLLAQAQSDADSSAHIPVAATASDCRPLEHAPNGNVRSGLKPHQSRAPPPVLPIV